MLRPRGRRLADSILDWKFFLLPLEFLSFPEFSQIFSIEDVKALLDGCHDGDSCVDLSWLHIIISA